MKPEFISISQFAIVATMAASLLVIGTVCAQQDTGIGSNPHIRAKSAPTPPSGTVTVKLSHYRPSGLLDLAHGFLNHGEMFLEHWEGFGRPSFKVTIIPGLCLSLELRNILFMVRL